ncbi:hypothetical protein C8R46DRAFT_1042390 [Mycena filopes]|nr:hypothetical protein C8R46DRAFT_1042390 [Mycena filopes]
MALVRTCGQIQGKLHFHQHFNDDESHSCWCLNIRREAIIRAVTHHPLDVTQKRPSGNRLSAWVKEDIEKEHTRDDPSNSVHEQARTVLTMLELNWVPNMLATHHAYSAAENVRLITERGVEERWMASAGAIAKPTSIERSRSERREVEAEEMHSPWMTQTGDSGPACTRYDVEVRRGSRSKLSGGTCAATYNTSPSRFGPWRPGTAGSTQPWESGERANAASCTTPDAEPRRYANGKDGAAVDIDSWCIVVGSRRTNLAAIKSVVVPSPLPEQHLVAVASQLPNPTARTGIVDCDLEGGDYEPATFLHAAVLRIIWCAERCSP